MEEGGRLPRDETDVARKNTDEKRTSSVARGTEEKDRGCRAKDRGSVLGRSSHVREALGVRLRVEFTLSPQGLAQGVARRF